jgi:ABC-2 type transport system ATP-binding protein
MQRRIGLAQALINDPEFLILDEPTTGLDPLGTRQVKDLIIELGRRGKTILLSSHLLADVEDCVSRMIVLYGGQKREEGTCESLLESRERVNIEAEPLDDATIAEIDEVIRRRTSGQKSILSVTRPRQKLEELFLNIVERARAQQVQTSGATAGGQTAAFLRADDASDGLVDRLVQASSEPVLAAATARVAETPAAPTGPDTNVLDSLLKPVDEVRPVVPAKPVEPAKDVNRSVIDSLLSGQGDDPKGGGA